MDFLIRKAVITGATGAIGTALIKKLMEEGASVTVFTRPDSPRKTERWYVFPALSFPPRSRFMVMPSEGSFPKGRRDISPW